MYKVVIYRAKIFTKDVRNLDASEKKRLFDVLDKLEDPFGLPLQIKKLKQYPVADYRIKIGRYRVLINIDKKEKTVYVLRVLPRKQLY